MQKRGLGKGLSALIPEKKRVEGEAVVLLDVNQIRPSKYQPRETFGDEGLKELAASIKEKGVIQPLLVRPVEGGSESLPEEGYELIAGERRLRAIKSLGISQVPALVKEVKDDEVLELSLIENIQRENLNPIEEAHAYQRLGDEFGFTQEDLARRIGKDRTTISNKLRILKLPKKVLDNVSRETISEGHARALLALDNPKDQIEICEIVLRKSLSVRELENLIKRGRFYTTRKIAQKKNPQVFSTEEELQRALGTKVTIIQGKKRGKIQIEYYSAEDRERLIGLLKGVH